MKLIKPFVLYMFLFNSLTVNIQIVFNIFGIYIINNNTNHHIYWLLKQTFLPKSILWKTWFKNYLFIQSLHFLEKPLPLCRYCPQTPTKYFVGHSCIANKKNRIYISRAAFFLSFLVVLAGLEPARSQWSMDFKSTASTIPPQDQIHHLKKI